MAVTEDKKVKAYLRFSGMAFQLIAVILIGYFVGKWIDRKLESDKPYATAGLILVMISVYLYTMIKQLNQNSEKK